MGRGSTPKADLRRLVALLDRTVVMTARRGPPSRKVAAWLPVATADAVRRAAQLAGLSEAGFIAVALESYMGDRSRRLTLLPFSAILAELARLRNALATAHADTARSGDLSADLDRISEMMRSLTAPVFKELDP